MLPAALNALPDLLGGRLVLIQSGRSYRPGAELKKDGMRIRTELAPTAAARALKSKRFAPHAEHASTAC